FSLRHGVDTMIWWGNVVELAGAAIGLAMMFYIDVLGLVAIVAIPTLISIGNGIILPNAIAGAVSVRPLAAGTASGLLGCTQMLFGALMAQIAGHLVAGATTAWPMVVQMVLTTVACAAVYVW